MTASTTDAEPTAPDGVTTGAVGVTAAAPLSDVAPSLLRLVTPVADADVETGSCVDGVCAVDSPG